MYINIGLSWCETNEFYRWQLFCIKIPPVFIYKGRYPLFSVSIVQCYNYIICFANTNMPMSTDCSRGLVAPSLWAIFFAICRFFVKSWVFRIFLSIVSARARFSFAHWLSLNRYYRIQMSSQYGKLAYTFTKSIWYTLPGTTKSAIYWTLDRDINLDAILEFFNIFEAWDYRRTRYFHLVHLDNVYLLTW